MPTPGVNHLEPDRGRFSVAQILEEREKSTNSRLDLEHNAPPGAPRAPERVFAAARTPSLPGLRGAARGQAPKALWDSSRKLASI